MIRHRKSFQARKAKALQQPHDALEPLPAAQVEGNEFCSRYQVSRVPQGEPSVQQTSPMRSEHL